MIPNSIPLWAAYERILAIIVAAFFLWLTLECAWWWLNQRRRR
jgi:hypothetical protein